MAVRRFLVCYAVAAVLFTVLDGVWLGVLAADLYDRLLGPLLAESPRLWAAVTFYALYVAGLVHFVVLPALEREAVGRAFVSGAFFGLVAYATWDLTNLAVIDGFPASLVLIDLVWGATLSAVVAGLTAVVVRRLGR